MTNESIVMNIINYNFTSNMANMTNESRWRRFFWSEAHPWLKISSLQRLIDPDLRAFEFASRGANFWGWWEHMGPHMSNTDDVVKTMINHPFGNGLYHNHATYLYLFMVIWGIVYYLIGGLEHEFYFPI